MLLYVVVEMPLGLERLVTAFKGALERTFSRMNANMCFQVPLFVESLATIIIRTKEGTAPCLRIKKFYMSPFMSLEHAESWVGLLACPEFTFECPLSMHYDVRL